ncbi:hypothetical protein [Kineococcus sp. SYSU DK004]|uniref:hypothetical protein n=1 Tax=Kineococcus sp. SYSU DK004 TaxID=3383125 RepID=UPI003D7D5136
MSPDTGARPARRAEPPAGPSILETFAGLDDEPFGDPAAGPRRRAGATRTSAAFGDLEVGPPVPRPVVAPAAQVATAGPAGPVAAGPADGPGDAERSERPERPERPERCPHCAARVRAEQDWCSLCLAPLDAPVPDDPAAGPAELTAPVEPAGAVEPPGPDPEEVERMLAALAGAQGPALPGLSRRAAVGVAAGGGLALTAVLVLLMTLLGLLAR